MKPPRIALLVSATLLLLLLLAACTPNPPTTQPPEPRITSDGTYDYIMVEPRFTIETVPEYGNTKRYVELLYQPCEAVAEALSVAPGDGNLFYMPENETLWGRDFYIMLEFNRLYGNRGDHLYSVTYSLKIPSDKYESEVEYFLSALTELYGAPDEPGVNASYPESVKRWTLDKHIEEAAGGAFSPTAMTGAEGVGIVLDFHSSTFSSIVRRDTYDISLVYRIAPYRPVLQLIE